jgi:hypothetical protein
MQGFSSSVIGLASVPAAIGQSLASQLAGRCSGQAQQRATVLVGAVAPTGRGGWGEAVEETPWNTIVFIVFDGF